jgi:predicted adenylyl cyclase CyaB
MQNIEIKSPLLDRAFVESTLERLGASREWELHQRDTFFEVSAGWLKIREQEDCPVELISYRRSTDDSGPRASDYDVEPLRDAETWKRLLGRVLERRGVVDKRRTLWLLRHTRIHLDRVAELGDFLELETVVRGITPQEAAAETDEIIESLNLDRSGFLSVPYLELMLENG